MFMNVKQNENQVIFSSKKDSREEMAEKIKQHYAQYKELHIILNFEDEDLKPQDFIPFEALARQHRHNGKSFVVVGSIDFDEIDDEISVVPTLLEAYDLIQLEEIERDLGF